jgi:hypothetical protein
MSFGLHVIESNGLFHFVGSVPYELAYVTKAGNAVTASEIEREMRLPARYRMIKGRTFASREEAWREAARLGFVEQVSC